MQNNELNKLVLAALLHDVGKFAERAGMEVSPQYSNDNEQLYQPLFDGRYSHGHALFTAAFIEKFADHLPLLDDSSTARSGDSLINLAGMHHKPETPLQWIITMADRLSSGLDRQVFDGDHSGVAYRDFRKTRLIPITEELSRGTDFYKKDSSETYQFRYGLKARGAEHHFAEKKAAVVPDDDAAAKAEYSALFLPFTTALAALQHKEYPDLWLEHFTNLWERFTAAIPAATVGKVIPDVSLYDHCRSTAALAVALYLYHQRSHSLNEIAIRNLEGSKFLLITGDFYGIQNFIFSEGGSTNRSAAKLLRGRSFAVSVLSELAADRLCRVIGVPTTSILLNAAGKFTILAANLPETLDAILSVEKELNAWLVPQFHGEVAIGFSTVAASGNDFAMNNFPGLWLRLGSAAEAKKFRKFSLADHGGVISAYLDSFDNQLGLCPFCGKRAARSETQGDHDLGDHEAACLICRDQVYFGAQLTKSRRIAILDSNTAFHGKKLRAPLFGLYQLCFDLSDKEEQRLAHSGALLRSMHLARAGEPLQAGLAVRFISGYVPTYSQEDEYDGRILHGRMSDAKKLELIDMIKAGGAKSFHHLAKAALNIRSDAEDKFTGSEALGILKADVDNLGKLFSCGLPAERLNLSRLATFSRQLDGFFSVYLPQLLATDARFKNIYTVFAGGDDLFLVGPWNRIIEFAPVLQANFARFACGNPEITISVGITVDKPGVPVPTMAARAEEALEAAKDGGRNRLTLFGETVTWGEFADLQQKHDTLQGWQQKGYLGKAMLYRLNSFMALARREKDLIQTKKSINMEEMNCLAWRSRFTYSATRNVGMALDKESRKNALDEVMQVASWLHDHDGKLKIALWQLLYNQR